MSDKLYPVSAEWAQRAYIDDAKYKDMYAASVRDPEGFWAEHGKRIDWIQPYTRVKNTSYAPGAVSIKWFEDGLTNVALNCVDRHVATRGDQVAIIWRATTPPSRATSPTRSCTPRCAASPMCSRRRASGRATASPSTCR